MKNFWKSGHFLKFASVLAAVLLWIFVAYEENPVHETWLRDVPVSYINRSADFENGKLLVIEGDSETVDVKIRGDRSVLASIKASSVKCAVDFADISSDGEYTLNINASTSANGIEIVNKKPNNVKLVIDTVVTREKTLAIIKEGTPDKGFVAGNIEASPKTIKLTGPKSVVDKVKSAKINVDISGANDDVANLYKIKLYDDSEKEITDDRINKNVEYCDVRCPILASKDVKIEPVLAAETNASGDNITVSSVSPDKVTLMGKPDQLKRINSVHTKPVSARDIYTTVKREVDLDIDSLPDGVYISGDVSSAKVELRPESDSY